MDERWRHSQRVPFRSKLVQTGWWQLKIQLKSWKRQSSANLWSRPRTEYRVSEETMATGAVLVAVLEGLTKIERRKIQLVTATHRKRRDNIQNTSKILGGSINVVLGVGGCATPSRRQSEHTDRNVKLKPTVLFRTTPTHFITSWCYRKPFHYWISTMQSFKSYITNDKFHSLVRSWGLHLLQLTFELMRRSIW